MNPSKPPVTFTAAEKTIASGMLFGAIAAMFFAVAHFGWLRGFGFNCLLVSAGLLYTGLLTARRDRRAASKDKA